MDPVGITYGCAIKPVAKIRMAMLNVQSAMLRENGSAAFAGFAWDSLTCCFFFFIMAMAVLSFIPRYTVSKTSDRVYSCV
jgi:hypothetical protein